MSSKAGSRRITLYVPRGQERLLEWARKHTGAASLSEAVLRALAEMMAMVEERQRQALKGLHGLWRDAPEAEQALRETEADWEQWRTGSS